MEQKSPDETRWLARVLAIFSILLAFQVIVIQIQRISAANALPSTQQHRGYIFIVLGLGIAVFLFWLGYRLLICSSLWRISPWFSENFPMFEFYEYMYFRISKHIRSGLVAGVIMLIIALFVPYMLSLCEGLWICKFVRHIFFGIILWPARFIIEICNINSIEPVLAFPVVIIYLFLVGFCTGAAISCLASKVNQIRKKRACKEFVAPEP